MTPEDLAALHARAFTQSRPWRATEFADRYYDLCRDYPIRDLSPCKLPAKEVRQILSEIGRDESGWHSSVRAFEHEQTFGSLTVTIGFRIHGRTSVDFDFCAEYASDDRIGNSFAGIAHNSAVAAGHPKPDPPFPRPEFHTPDEFRRILTEAFALGDLLIATAQKATT